MDELLVSLTEEECDIFLSSIKDTELRERLRSPELPSFKFYRIHVWLTYCAGLFVSPYQSGLIHEVVRTGSHLVRTKVLGKHVFNITLSFLNDDTVAWSNASEWHIMRRPKTTDKENDKTTL